jgi:hypothetical protein
MQQHASAYSPWREGRPGLGRRVAPKFLSFDPVVPGIPVPLAQHPTGVVTIIPDGDEDTAEFSAGKLRRNSNYFRNSSAPTDGSCVCACPAVIAASFHIAHDPLRLTGHRECLRQTDTPQCRR